MTEQQCRKAAAAAAPISHNAVFDHSGTHAVLSWRKAKPVTGYAMSP